MNDSIPDVVIVVDKSEFYERFGFGTVFTNVNGILDFVESEKSKRAWKFALGVDFEEKKTSIEML